MDELFLNGFKTNEFDAGEDAQPLFIKVTVDKETWSKVIGSTGY